MMPLSSDVSQNIRELKKAHPDWPNNRIVAAALSGARAAGNKSVKKKGK